MDAINRCITIVQRRVFFQDWLTATGRSMLVGLCVAGGLVLADRLLAVVVGGWVYALIGVAVVGAGVLGAWWRQPGRHAAAVLIDQRCALKDCVASALYASTLDGEPMARSVVDDAEAVAQRLSLKSAFPLRLTRVWTYAPLVTVGVLLLVVFLPEMDLIGVIRASQQKQSQQVRADAVQQEVLEAVTAVEQVTDAENKSDDSLEDAMKELAQISKQDLTQPELQRDAAAKLSQINQQLAQESQDRKEMFQSLQNTMSRLDPEVSGPADRFVDAMRRSDFDAAQDALGELAQSLDEMPGQDRQALRQQLDSLAGQLQQAASGHAQRAQDSQEQMRQTLQDAGMTEQQIEQTQQQGLTSDEIERMLTEQGLTSEQAQQLTQQIREMQQQRGNHDQNGETCEDLASALSRLNQQSDGQGSQQSSYDEMAKQLSELAKMQQELQKYRTARQQTQEALDQLYSQSSKPAIPPGTAEGGDPLGEERHIEPTQTHAVGDPNQGQGRVIASWMSDEGAVKNQAGVEFDQAVKEARDEAEQAVTDDRVPRRYHETVREYFNQMPQSPDQIKTPPPAPR